jgi:hypothetical protein
VRYPADAPKVEQIVAVMRTDGDGAHARRVRGRKAIGLKLCASAGRLAGHLPTELVDVVLADQIGLQK